MRWQFLVRACRAAPCAAAALLVVLWGAAAAPLWASPPLGEVQTIVFDDVVGPGNPAVTGVQVGPWLFAAQQFHTVSLSDAGILGFANNGTPYIDSVGGAIDFPITLERADGQPFSLLGFDAAEGFLDDIAAAEAGYVSATSIEVEAMLASGFTVTLTYDLDGERDGPNGVDDFEAFATAGDLGDVTSLTFTGLNGARRDAAFALDNVVVAAIVPEPASATLLFAALGAITMLAARRRYASMKRLAAS